MLNVDIVIPTYNQGEALSYVLKGFSKQRTSYSYHIIVVDDGSDQNIGEQISQMGINNIPITYVRQENQGRARARNFGASHGIGELIIFNDCDRIPGPYYIESHVNCHLNNSVNFNGKNKITIGTPKELYINKYAEKEDLIKKIVEEDLPLSKLSLFTRNILNIFDSSGYTDSYLPWLATFSGNMSISRYLFENNLFDENFKKWGFENIEFGYRLFKKGCSFLWSKPSINYHLAHARSENFYQKGIMYSESYLKEKYGHARELSLIGEFLLGNISLQDFEKDAGNVHAQWMNNNTKVIINHLIS